MILAVFENIGIHPAVVACALCPALAGFPGTSTAGFMAFFG